MRATGKEDKHVIASQEYNHVLCKTTRLTAERLRPCPHICISSVRHLDDSSGARNRQCIASGCHSKIYLLVMSCTREARIFVSYDT